MSMISIVSLGISGVFLLAGALLFVLSYRNLSRQMSGKDRNQNKMDDRSERIIWEIGRGLPLVDSQPGGKTLTRRGFVPRFALGIFAALAGWSAARVWADTRRLPKTAGSTDGLASPMEAGANTQIAQQDHSDIESHGDDAHSDASGAGGLHYDIPHGDVNTHSDS